MKKYIAGGIALLLSFICSFTFAAPSDVNGGMYIPVPMPEPILYAGLGNTLFQGLIIDNGIMQFQISYLVEKKRMISFTPGLHGASSLTDQNDNELNGLDDSGGVNTDVNSILDDSNLLGMSGSFNGGIDNTKPSLPGVGADTSRMVKIK